MMLSVLPGPGVTGGGGLAAAERVGFDPLHRIRVPMLAVESAAPAVGTSATRVARILTPGPELACSFGIAFEPSSGQGITSNASAAWSATAMRSGSGEGREARYHALFTGELLPQLYTVAGLIPDIEVSALLTIPTDAAVAGIRGLWVLEVIWGSTGGVLCPADRDYLFNLCAVRGPSDRVGLLIP